ncbi:TetR/AcrR family transcriptional regulator [Sphingomonas colocasiae]|uniref:TetR/AcrR family transcriptional regulator n=1 Tax=Sphingomonas colocasiae TaxID=1848973 RepID=A0ABS7PQ20_9SPHN|nr:TetR/AcrR family transcriptional regulator [Sphingomonas colocasiae]MBY8823417.1 TetR/AcrR family transcriptional regulator [Sphingomonas colocasiae]
MRRSISPCHASVAGASAAAPINAGTTRRLTRQDWIAAARKLLLKRGIDEVKVDHLARQMRVTRSSFYSYFDNRKDLFEALLADWEARNYFDLARIQARWARSPSEMAAVIGLWLAEDPNARAFDIALRAWARRTAGTADSIRRVDDAWIGLLRKSFERDGRAADEALVRARITYLHQIGYWALDLDEKQDERVRLVPVYYRVLTGHEAPAELGKALTRQASTKPVKRVASARAIQLIPVPSSPTRPRA